MSIEFIILIGVICVGFSILVVLINKKHQSREMIDIMTLFQKNAHDDRALLLDSLAKNTQTINQRLDYASSVIGSVQKNIGEFTEIGRGMKELHDLLRAPKSRGDLGEQLLYDLLAQLLPSQTYKTQYRFKSGAVVDAIIKTSQGLIPIDAKFPLDHFRKIHTQNNEQDKKTMQKLFETDIKKHITTISDKYVLPGEETVDYALMYIPSEAVYYEFVRNESLYTFATSHRIMCVSPTTFYAFIKAVLMSFEGQKIQEQARNIVRTLHAIHQDFEHVSDSLETLNRHITYAYNTMPSVFSNIAKLGQRIHTVQKLDTPK